MMFPAITHVAVTVTDLPASVAWYQRLLGTEPVLDEDTGPFRHVVFGLDGGTLFGLHAFPGLLTSDRFDPRRPGLDHIAFACANRDELAKWQARLEELGIEHGGIVDAAYGSGLSFKDPDGVALEFFAPPA
jgi:catechol-2,3-dioxygenase